MQGTWGARVGRDFILTRKESKVDAETVITKVRVFLAQLIGDKNIDLNTNLFESGLVNSLFAMQLLLYVEQEFSIQITNEDLDFENFRSLNAIAEFVVAKLGAGA